MAGNWYFFYQRDGKESPWEIALSSSREAIVHEKQPAFSTVLDLSGVPDNNVDWSVIRYQGPLYFDFDADGDLDLACSQFQAFIAKLEAELEFDVMQARLYCSGSKGFHIEIPMQCFIPKPAQTGYPWLAYIYREMAQSLYVETLDLMVYTGKRGRQWRTPNVERENGCYKVPISFGEALSMTPDLYRDLIKEPRETDAATPPSVNTKFAVLFDRAKEKVTRHMRGRKSRQEKAVKFLEPWKASKKTPPSIEGLMSGEIVSENARFQELAMQLSIYATSVGMPLAEFLDRCRGLCETHVSDSSRYNTLEKRRAELTRMWEYMGENTLYDFEVAPLIKLIKRGTTITDLGVVEKEDKGDTPEQPPSQDAVDGDTPSTAPDAFDMGKGVRRGFYMNADGMFRKLGDVIEPVCRATLRKVESLVDLESKDFRGYEFDLVVNEKVIRRPILSAETFTSAQKLRQFMANYQLSYQGGEGETSALLDVMAEKAARNGVTYVYPREGFFVIDHPEKKGELVKVYLTQDTFLSSIPKDDPSYFKLRYKPTDVLSSYQIDIHKAPELNDSHIPAIEALFNLSRTEELADMLGWFIACHYRSIYLELFGQFPLLHIYGEAGAGKTKSVEILSRLHWYQKSRVHIMSAISSTNFALDASASSTTSCPMIIDEWKPKEMRAIKGRIEKLKDVLKASYVGSNIGNRGTLNKAAENGLGVVKSKATAPIVFIAEAIEVETAIFERSVVVALTQELHKGNKARQAACDFLYEDATALSALGRATVEMGFTIDTPGMRQEVMTIRRAVEASLPDLDGIARRAAPRLIYNRTVILHALSILKRVLQMYFGSRFDADCDRLMGSRKDALTGDEGQIATAQGMSEASKMINQLAQMSRMRDQPWEIKPGKDYIVGPDWLEIKAESCYSAYRRYCAAIHDSPLFINLETMVFALHSYSPTIDRICASSDLRDDGSNERIFRFNLDKLRKEGVQSFRT